MAIYSVGIVAIFQVTHKMALLTIFWNYIKVLGNVYTAQSDNCVFNSYLPIYELKNSIFNFFPFIQVYLSATEDSQILIYLK